MTIDSPDQVIPNDPRENKSDYLNSSVTSSLEDSSLATKTQSDAKWIDNNDQPVEQVFGFNVNAELVNGRAAMIGFLMLVLTELVFSGKPVTESIFGIG